MRKTEIAFIVAYIIFFFLQIVDFPGKVVFFWLITVLMFFYYGIGGYWIFGEKERGTPIIGITAGVAFATAILTVFYNIRLFQHEVWQALPILNILFFIYIIIVLLLKDSLMKSMYVPLAVRSGIILVVTCVFAYGDTRNSLVNYLLTNLNSGEHTLVQNLKMIKYHEMADEYLEEENCDQAIIAAIKSTEAAKEWLSISTPPSEKDLNLMWQIEGTYKNVYEAFKCKGEEFYSNKHYNQALTNFQKADSFLNILPKEKYENWKIQRAESKNRIGDCYFLLSNYDSANALYLKAINYYIDSVGKKDYRLATYFFNLGNSLKQQLLLEHAKQSYTTSLNLYLNDSIEEKSGRMVGHTYLKIAECDLLEFKLEASLKNLEKASVGLKKKEDGLCVYHYLKGMVHLAQSHFELALQSAKATLHCEMGDEPFKSQNIARSYALLFDISLAKADYDSAKSYIDKGIEISKENYSLKSAEYHDYVRRLASFYYQNGNYAKAGDLYEQVLKVYIAELGEENEKVPVVLADLARINVEFGNLDKAKSYINKCLRIGKAQNYFHNSSSANLLNDIAYVKYVSGEMNVSDSIYNKVLEMALNDAGDSTLAVGVALNGTGLLAISKKKYLKADTLFERALKLHERYFGRSHPFSAIVVMNRGELKMRKKELEGSEIGLKASLLIFQDFYPGSHPTIGDNLYLLGELFLLKKMPDQAKEYFQKAMEVYKENFSNEHYKVRGTQKRLISLQS